MIRRLFCILMALFCVSACAFAQDYSGWVRLHVVADGDDAYAQALKMEVRDACLECAARCLSGAQDADEAYMLLEKHLPEFGAAAEKRARELGYTGPVRAETGVFSFPDRIYGGALVPAGEYRALRVTVGSGSGHNWWCVLYPTLCFADESALASGEMPPRRGLFFELFEKWRMK